MYRELVHENPQTPDLATLEPDEERRFLRKETTVDEVWLEKKVKVCPEWKVRVLYQYGSVVVVVWNVDGGTGRPGGEGGRDCPPLTEKGFYPKGLFHRFSQCGLPSRHLCWHRDIRHTNGALFAYQWCGRLAAGRHQC